MHRLAVVALSAVLFWSPTAFADAPPLRVVATFSVLGDMVTRIGGDHVSVTTLVGPDGDAHVFEPSPADARALAGADLLVMNGLGLDHWADRLKRAAGYTGQVVVASVKVAARDHDPHAWQDIGNGRLYAAEIGRALAATDPADAEFFGRNAAAYDSELASLDQWVRQSLAEIPPAKRRVITTHDAFGYFGAAYGVEFLAPVGLSTDAEPSAGAIGGLIRQIRTEQIKALFLENISDPRLIEMLASEAGVRPGGALYSDALSPPGKGAETYVAMFRHNVPTLVAGMKLN